MAYQCTSKILASFFLLLFGSASLSNAALLVLNPSSIDSVLGGTETAEPLGYYADIDGEFANSGVVGIAGIDGTRNERNAVIGFILPVLDGPITSATITLTVASTNNSSGNMAIDLYGLSGVTNPDTSGTTLFFEGPTDPNTSNVRIAQGIASTTTGSGTSINIDITTYLADFYTGNTPDQTEVFFRLNPNTVIDLGTTSGPRRVTFDLSEATITVNAVPEPSAAILTLSSGLLLSVRRRKQNS